MKAYLKPWTTSRTFLMALLLLVLTPLNACGPRPARTQNPQVQPSASAAPTARPTPLPSAAADAPIQAILTSQQLELRVSEELMLIGDVRLANGRQVSFDAVMNQLELENQNPDLLAIDLQNRIIRALKAGTATVLISARNRPELRTRITVQIADLANAIDPNIALVDVEID